jgi:hypothetical protein
MGLIPNAMDNAMFDFGNFGNGGIGMDYLGDHNDFLSYPRDFHSDLFNMQNF